MKKCIAFLFLGFFSMPSVFAAFPASVDTDGDGVPDRMEFWLRAHGIAVSETAPDTYIDTDGDGIPDLVEDNISRTDKTVNESTVATAIAGFGLSNNTGEIAGQWDICVHTNTTDNNGNGISDECENVYQAADYVGVSVMHSTSDQIKSYLPDSGYATSESYNSGTNAYTATFSETLDNGAVVTNVINATFDGVSGMTGTLDTTEGGVAKPQVLITGIRRTSGWTGTGDPSGIYAIQDTSIDTNTGLPFARSSNFTPENSALELSFNGTEVLVYGQYGSSKILGLLYIPALGVIADVAVTAEQGDLDFDGAIDDTSYEVVKASSVVLALPAGNNSGLIRGGSKGSSYNDINSNQPLANGLPTGFLDKTVVPGTGDSIFFDKNHFYARHHEPRVVAFTRNTTAGFESVISLNNVPLAASRITVSGPGGFTATDVVNESGGPSMMDAVSIRNRANPESRPDGFVGLQVGMSGGNTHNVSNISIRSAKTPSVTNLFPAGTYTYSTGVSSTFNDPRNTASVSADYTPPASAAALPDVTNPEPMTRQIGGGSINVLNPGVPLNRFVLGGAKNNAGVGIDLDTTQLLTLTWPAVAGAGKYVVRIACVVGPQNNCDDVEEFRRATSGTTAQIPANTLNAFVAYRIFIEARNVDGSLRSMTTGIGINNTIGDELVQTSSLSEGPNVTGWSNAGSGTNFEVIRRPGNTGGSGSGSGIGFILMHGRCGIAEGSVVSSLRRRIARDGYDTISIRLPADVSTAENTCSGSTTPFSAFEAGAAYVVPESVARVRQAINELVSRNGSINRVVLVGFSLGTRLATAAAAASNHKTPTPLPVVGLILAGTRSGSTATGLDTTTALGEITVPVLDFYMDQDFPAVSTAAARLSAYAGNTTDYTQTSLTLNDNWGLVDGSTSNIRNPRHKFLGYEGALNNTVSDWIANTSLTNPVTATSSDIVIDFGAIGLWARMNDSAWLKLNNSSPDQVVIGDVDGNGRDDVIADFSSTFGGIFVKRNQGGWSKLHNFTPELLTTGDLDGNGKDDIVIDFGSIGLWARMNDSAWLKLNNSSPDQVIVGDVDGNGMDDVIADFSSTFGGIFIKRNQGVWSKLHNNAPGALAVGDLDNNGKDDIVIDFGAIGLWARMNDAAWLKLHNSSPDLIATGDVDGNGADDVLATFPGQGLWQKLNLGGWGQMNANAPDELLSGDVDGSGQDDIIARFGSTIGGIFVKRNGGAWAKLHNTSPDSMAVGNLDGL